jgi:hypothetical protein
MNPMRSNTGRSSRGQMGGRDIVPKGTNLGQLSQFTPEQTQLFQSLFGHLDPQSFLSQIAGGDQGAFDEMEAPAMRQFNELTGGLSSKFSQGSGGQSLGLGRSSGFKNSNTAAASNFAQDLQSKRQDLKRQALMDLFGLSNSLLGQRPYDRFLAEKPQQQGGGFLDQLAGGFGKALPSALIGGATGGPAGAAIGGFGSLFSSLFGGSGNNSSSGPNLTRGYV